MDLAKMAAVLELISELEDENFHIWRQTRTGLLSYPLETNAARAHLAASIYVQMALKPHIVHVVGHTEAHHAATAEDVIDACRIGRRAIENALAGQPAMLEDPIIIKRKEELVNEARLTIMVIQNLHRNTEGDPLISPENLSDSVKKGILDAPHLKNNPFARGEISTRIMNGACEAVDKQGKKLSEADRLKQFI